MRDFTKGSIGRNIFLFSIPLMLGNLFLQLYNLVNSVLVGHSGLVRTKMFDDIDKLENGDFFYINVLSRVLVYKVDEIK
ncbi:MAG: hypothetical protein U0K90_00235, partial [Bacteroidales bacterium]|nr:hypothetical protein [Bacteroidales bacterium]